MYLLGTKKYFDLLTLEEQMSDAKELYKELEPLDETGLFIIESFLSADARTEREIESLCNYFSIAQFRSLSETLTGKQFMEMEKDGKTVITCWAEDSEYVEKTCALFCYDCKKVATHKCGAEDWLISVEQE